MCQALKSRACWSKRPVLFESQWIGCNKCRASFFALQGNKYRLWHRFCSCRGWLRQLMKLPSPSSWNFANAGSWSLTTLDGVKVRKARPSGPSGHEGEFPDPNMTCPLARQTLQMISWKSICVIPRARECILRHHMVVCWCALFALVLLFSGAGASGGGLFWAQFFWWSFFLVFWWFFRVVLSWWCVGCCVGCCVPAAVRNPVVEFRVPSLCFPPALFPFASLAFQSPPWTLWEISTCGVVRSNNFGTLPADPLLCDPTVRFNWRTMCSFRALFFSSKLFKTEFYICARLVPSSSAIGYLPLLRDWHH